MNQQLKDKIAKIQELINRGATDGEKAAAKKALDRIVKAHNIDESQLTSVLYKDYYFKFSSINERILLGIIMHVFLETGTKCAVQTHRKRIKASLLYEEWVTIECCYEYFRRHMKAEYKRIVLPQLIGCRTAKTRKNKKERLDMIFLSNYSIASKLYKEGELTEINIDEMSKQEAHDRTALNGVQGGQYNKQVISNLLLEN